MTTSPNEDYPASFADYCYQNFLPALLESPSEARYYRLAGYTICLWFAGREMLRRITPALEHLAVAASSSCDLTVCVWDSASTHRIAINLPENRDAYTVWGEILGYNNQRVTTVIDKHNGTLNVFDRKRKLAIHWINDANTLPWWIGGSPLQMILHWFMLERGLQLTHAGAVGYQSGGVLLTGKGGSGKSTTALSCLKAGMNYVSEDYCLLSEAPDPYSYCVYNSAKLEPHTLQLFPEMSAYIANTDRQAHEKAFIYQHQHYPDKIIDGFPLKALLVLSIENSRQTTLEGISTEEALPSLVISTMWQLIHTGMRTMTHLKKVAEGLPCYRLRLGSDLKQIPAIIESLL